MNWMKGLISHELDERIDKSESDFENNKFKTSSELLKKFQ